MPNYEEAIVCFTDIKGSTSLSEQLGSEEYSKFRNEHIALAGVLAELFEGTIDKNTGDGVPVWFRDAKKAAAFACNMQFFYKTFPSKKASPIKIKIGINVGTVEVYADDRQGSTVNIAARLTDKAQEDEIIVSEEFLNSVKKIFGANQKIVENPCEVSLKGIENKVTMYHMNADIFFDVDTVSSFYMLAYQHMRALGVQFANIKSEELKKANLLILPIVPRKNINLVHRGLFEIVRFFSILGWKIAVLIADFGRQDLGRQLIDDYVKKMNTIFDNLNIANHDITILSDLISDSNKDSCCSITYKHFYPYLSSVKVGEMRDILGKQYTADEKDELDKSYLTSLRPIFTLAGVREIIKGQTKKCVVLSGDDERAMWGQCISLGYENTLGAIHIPIVKKDSGYQYNQNLKSLFWTSSADIIDDMGKSNIAEWAVRQVFSMEEFPCKKILLQGETILSPEESDYSRVADAISERLV